jgi:hypothetical protein
VDYSPGRLRSVVVLSLAIACATNVAACAADVSAYASAIQRRTVPPGAAATAVVEARRTDVSVTFSWDVSSTWSIEQYGDWITRAFERDFTAIAPQPDVLVFTRESSGDVYRLECRLTRGEDGLTVHATFTAAAN